HDAGNNVVTSVPLGATVHDRAAVSGVSGFTPTGTVDFTWFTNGSCSGTGSSAGTVALDASGVADPSQSRGPLGGGAYSFRAHYGGDANYGQADSPCEPLIVTIGTPTVATEIRDAGNNTVTSAPLGTTVHDRAVASGVAGFTPTG